MALAYDKALKGSQAETQPQSFDQRWTAWGSAFGGAGHIDGNAAAGTSNVTASDYGIAAGMDYHATPNITYGFGLAGKRRQRARRQGRELGGNAAGRVEIVDQRIGDIVLIAGETACLRRREGQRQIEIGVTCVVA